MTIVYNSLKLEFVPGDYKYVRLIEDFKFYSDTIEQECVIPQGFISDLESVPLLRGTNPESGVIHDYFCRIDSVPVVSRRKAAAIYREFQKFYDKMESGNFFNRIFDWIRWQIKVFIVNLFKYYFHKYKVMATYEEIVEGEK